jgi:DNA-binding NtrC family response regulator
MSDKQVIQVCFLTQDTGLAEAVARALGEGFTARASSELRFEVLSEMVAWADVLLIDLRANVSENFDEAALRLMGKINEVPGHPPMVVLCDEEQRGPFLRAVEYGADDSVTSPPNISEVRLVLRRAYKLHTSEQELRKLRGRESAGRLHELIGTSAPMQELFAMARKIATCDVSVLITGETGTGKELLARAIHHLSGRNSGPLVAFSCANLPETLIEDELFGHEKGAFTGAIMSRCGRLEAANHGTLFLDEIGDLGLGLQPKLLRVLQERRFERLGGNKTINVDLRLVCATNRNLAEMVQQGKFRCANVTTTFPCWRNNFWKRPRTSFKKRPRAFRNRLCRCSKNLTGQETCANSKMWCSGAWRYRMARRWIFVTCLRRCAHAENRKQRPQPKICQAAARMKTKCGASSAV